MRRLPQLLILTAWGLTLAANAPGQLSYDLVVQLAEGRTLEFGAFTGGVIAHPPIMSLLLGLFDAILPGTALYLLVVSSAFFGGLLLVVGKAPRFGWGALVVLLLFLATPLVLVYQGIVWKDVLFANLSVLAFNLLLVAPGERGGRRFAWLAAAIALGALAALVRQNGLIVLFFVALAACLTEPGNLRRLRTLLRLALLTVAITAGAFVAAAVAQTLVMRAVAEQASEGSLKAGLALVARYDIAGILARGGTEVGELAERGIDVASARDEARAFYGADRVDRLAEASFMTALGSPDDVLEIWRQMVADNPRAYFAHRLDVLRWLVWPPKVWACLPLHVGVAGRPDLVQALGLPAGVRPQDQTLYDYARKFVGTPVFWHGAYLLGAAALVAYLALQQAPAARVIVPMLLSAVAFTLSFAAIGIACDFRYAYFLPLAFWVSAIAVAGGAGRRAPLVSRLRELATGRARGESACAASGPSGRTGRDHDAAEVEAGANLVAGLFETTSIVGLRAFAAELDRKHAFPAALGFFVDAFLATREDRPATNVFVPADFLSRDLSAILYDRAPVIFMGSNRWSLLRFREQSELLSRAEGVVAPLQRRIAASQGRVHVVVVPEKDVMIDWLFRDRTVQAGLDQAVRHVLEAVRSSQVSTGFDEIVADSSASPSSYDYPDSHLLPEDDVSIFRNALRGLGLSKWMRDLPISFEPQDLWGDLTVKFGDARPRPTPFHAPLLTCDAISQEAGSRTFEASHAATWQRFRNRKAPIRASISIHGDSHSSIYAARKLTYLFAHTFESCIFTWDPLGLRGADLGSSTDFTVLEMSQRFLFARRRGPGTLRSLTG